MIKLELGKRIQCLPRTVMQGTTQLYTNQFTITSSHGMVDTNELYC